MAHRSGGGSHRSGGHSHSHSSSHSRSHSSSHRSSGFSSSRSYGSSYNSHNHYHNHHRRRYVYYNNRGQERYVYSENQPKNMGVGCLVAFIIVFMLFFIPFILGFFNALKDNTGTPERLAAFCRNRDSHIADNAEVINNKSELEESLRSFEKKTGICPYVITVNNENWYLDFEDFSFRLYEKTFGSNEDHFLVVYSEPKSGSESQFNDWYWEAIQGDNTDPIITEKKFDKFKTELQAYLEDNNNTCGNAMIKAFDHSGDYFMEANGSSGVIPLIVVGVVLMLIPILVLILFIKWFAANRKRVFTEDTSYIEGNSSNGYMTDNSMNRNTAAMTGAAGYSAYNQNRYGSYNGYGSSGYGQNSSSSGSMNQYGNQYSSTSGSGQSAYGSANTSGNGYMNQQPAFGNTGNSQNYGSQNAFSQNSSGNINYQQPVQRSSYGEMDGLMSPPTVSSLPPQPQVQNNRPAAPVQASAVRPQPQNQPSDNNGEDDMMAKILAGYGNNNNK